MFLSQLACVWRFSRSSAALAQSVMSSDVSASPSQPISTDANDNVYAEAEAYWQKASRDVDGMLGGFAHLHRPDVSQSASFLSFLRTKHLLLHKERALDCGCGIGRVTKHLLMPVFDKVDMVDVVGELVEQSKEYIGADPRVGDKFVEGLQTFTPKPDYYDLIWVQWVSGHLTDDDFIAFFKRCKEGLRNGGCVVLKDNLTKSVVEFDSEDHSWTRPETLVKELFEKAGLKVVGERVQTAFPKGMYKVKMFALK